MGIFKKKNSHPDNLNTSLSLNLKKYIHQIQLLVGVTQADFNKLYVDVIRKLDRAYPLSLDDMLKLSIQALKRRRGYLLPVGADSEVSFREHEVWTYATFTAAILKYILLNLSCESIDSLKELIPLQGLIWLERSPVLIEEWQSYLVEGSETVFTELIIISLKEDHKNISDGFF